MKVDSEKFKRLCDASIIDYLKAKQIPFQANGKAGYYHLTDHDSLVIVAEGTGHYRADTFFWNSRGLSGNLYRFITDYMGIPKGQFVDEVLATLGEDAGPRQDYQKEDEQPFDQSQWPDCGFHQQIFAYLTKRCGLAGDLVNRLLDTDILRQLSSNDGLLLWRNSHQRIVGASQLYNQNRDQLVTRTSQHSQHYYGFNIGYRYQAGQPYTLLVFEDPLRALAYCQALLHNDDQGAYRLLSVGGAATRLPAIENYVNEWGLPTEIRLCLDNDQAGLIMAAKFFVDHQGADGQVTMNVNDEAQTVPVRFDHPAADHDNFIGQGLAGEWLPQAMSYDQLLDEYDQQHGAGAAQKLIASTPGLNPASDAFTTDVPPMASADDDQLAAPTAQITDDLPF